MLILRQNNYSFFTPRKDAEEFYKKVQNYKKYDEIDIRDTQQFSKDFKQWLGFVEVEVTKRWVRLFGEKDKSLIIWINDLEHTLKENIIAFTEGSSCFKLIYNKDRKIYQVIYGAMSRMQFMTKAINKLFKQEGKVYFECKTAIEGIDWLRKNIVMI